MEEHMSNYIVTYGEMLQGLGAQLLLCSFETFESLSESDCSVWRPKRW